MEEQVSQLEKRAATAEKTIAAMQKQLAGGAASAASNDGLEQRLRTLLKLMEEDRDECEAIRAQRDELKAENERLRALASKHEYRCKHLLRTIDEIEAKQKQ